MFRALVRPESSIHHYRYLSVADRVLPWTPHSFQFISTVELDGPMEFDPYTILREFLAGFANLEHLAFCFKFARVKKESSLPSWTGLRLRSLQCRARLVDSGLVHALLSWLAAFDSPRLTTLYVGLRDSSISPSCYVCDPMKTLLENSKATLRTLEVHISSLRSGACEYIIVKDAWCSIVPPSGEDFRFWTWLIPGCIKTLYLFIDFKALCTVMDGATLPRLCHEAHSDLDSAPSEDVLTRMTLPSLDRVSATSPYWDDEDKKLTLQPFASAKKREILEVTMQKADYSWLFE
jgi:hypothetical protein